MSKEQVTLGKILGPEAKRDAVHVAIAPVVAAEDLLPGSHVGLDEERCACYRAEEKLGVVDPFLKEPVKPGQRFYLFLYPNTITSLRHEWTHPAFGPSYPPVGSREESERWLMDYAKRLNTLDRTPEDALRRLIDGLKSGDFHSYGSEVWSLGDLEDAEELKEHAERYLGIKINYGDFSFSCGC